MDADFSVELGSDDPILDLPWIDPAGQLAYVDLKQHPELMQQVPEAGNHPELADFLHSVNSVRSLLESAKCDVWATTELTPEEEIFAAVHKFASYVDVVFVDSAARLSFPQHEEFSRRLVALLRRAPEIASAAEICVRRCFFGERGDDEGFYFTIYVNGYGDDQPSARKNWTIGLKLVENALAQLAADVGPR